MLQTGIVEGEHFEASLRLALDACRLFDMEREDANRTACRMAATISGTWREALCAWGASSAEIRAYSAAFQHDEMDRALALA